SVRPRPSPALLPYTTLFRSTDAAFILGTGKLWVKVPPTMKFVFEGEIPPYIMAKDLILQIIGDIGVDGANYRAMEFAGVGVMRRSEEHTSELQSRENLVCRL